jgi:uncharacterized protein YidB (DUF937 family)
LFVGRPDWNLTGDGRSPEQREGRRNGMGILDMVVKGLADKFLGGQGGQENPLVSMAMNLLSNPQSGGLQGLIQQFAGKGMGDVMSSWISTGENLPISGDQISQVLGSDTIRQFAQKLGSSNEEVSSGLAGILPQLIDKLTPSGQVPDGNSLEQALSMLRGMSGQK